MQNRAFLPTRLRNKKCCLSVGWGILRRKLMNDAIDFCKEFREREEEFKNAASLFPVK